ncbi:MAG: hypothetical protein IJO70_12300 [Lachnospiraceae bacterium]|nr:hypothetical protein [Lachnospiraceae bacterium]
MAEKIKVNYDILDSSINNLKTITEGVGGDNIRELIGGLDNVFDNTKSDTANALKARKEEYNNVNNMLINISLNIISLLEMAKMLYEHTDKSFANQLDANSSSAGTESDGN